jgi:hypothetical protein
VARVQFLVDGEQVGEDSTAPYQLAFDTGTLGNGPHLFAARALDGAGNSATAPAATATVANVTADMTPPAAPMGLRRR